MPARIPARAGPLSVTVAVLTRRRPQMLSALLDSFAGLNPPEDCDIRFLVVENDDEPRSRAIVEAREGQLPAGRLDYVLESEPGIPFARNRAAREAITARRRLLAFVDDDEIVDPDWLVRFVAGYRDSGAVLLGGPHGICAAEPGLSWLQRRIHHGLRRRFEKKAERAARLAGLGGTPGVNIVTNNWLAETSIFSDHDIWFDEMMRFTGGTDAKFSAEVKGAGLPTAWVADARVYENVPPERLSFAYQFRRARDQSNTTFRRKIAEAPSARRSALVSVPLKLLGVGWFTLLLLPTNGATLLDLAHTTGWIAGRLGALLDLRSSHYAETTGR